MKRKSIFHLFNCFFVKKPAGPVQLIHFVTSKCNAHCQHCFYRNNLNRDGDLSLDEIIRVTKNLPDLYFLLIGGGEPFLRKDLPDIIIAYHKNTGVKEVSIPTNGLLTDKISQDCQKILTKCPGLDVNLIISIDGPADIHNRIRGVANCFEKAVSTFYEIKKLKHAYPKLKIAVLSTLMPVNQDVMIDFLTYIKGELKPDSFSVNMLRSEPKNPALGDIRLENLEKVLDYEKQEIEKCPGLIAWVRRFIHRLRLDLLLRTVTVKKYIIPCRASDLTGVLSENGILYPCELLSRSMGNIKQFGYDFRKAWRSRQIRESKNCILKNRCFCTHECFTRLNIISNPGHITKSVLKKWAGCRM